MAINTGLGTSTNQPIQARLTKVAGNLLGINTQFSGPQLGPQRPRAKRFVGITVYHKLTLPQRTVDDFSGITFIFFGVL